MSQSGPIREPSEDPPLTDAERLLTAWVDGALSPQEAADFEVMLGNDPDLAIDAARHRELLDLTRSLQMMQPSDRESRRFWARLYNRGEWRIGWVLLITGTVLLSGFSLWELLASGLHVLVKIGTLAVLGGASILLWNTLRLKLRTSRFDRYRGVLY